LYKEKGNQSVRGRFMLYCRQEFSRSVGELSETFHIVLKGIEIARIVWRGTEREKNLAQIGTRGYD